jgi:hypothetical protein
MAKSIKVHQKKRGRPATGRDPAVTVRISAPVLAAAQEWAKGEGIESRSSAIARLVELGLQAKTSPRKR